MPIARTLGELGGLGPPAATPEVLADLTQVLQNPEGEVRSAAAGALAGLGPPAATPEVLAALTQVLRDPEGRLRSAAARAQGALFRLGFRLFFRRRWLRRPMPIARTLGELGGD
jgi:hypothetical protein